MVLQTVKLVPPQVQVQVLVMLLVPHVTGSFSYSYFTGTFCSIPRSAFSSQTVSLPVNPKVGL